MANATDEPAPPSLLRRGLWWLLRLGGTALGFAYIASVVDPAALRAALFDLPPWALGGALVTTAANLVLGAFRWRVLLHAYGAPGQPPFAFLVHAYYVGFFYNTYLPGGVGGDLVRGLVTRSSFGEAGMASSVTVVLVERILGLAGLLLLVSGTSLVAPLAGTELVLPASAVMLLGVGAAIGGVAFGRRLAVGGALAWLPGALRRVLAALPRLRRVGPFALAVALSVGTHSLVALTGWFVLAGLHPAVTLGQAAVIVPLAMAMAFFPFSVGGLGVREAALEVLAGRALGMASSEAVAAGLLIWFSQLAVAAIGGLLALRLPPDPPEPS